MYVSLMRGLQAHQKCAVLWCWAEWMVMLLCWLKMSKVVEGSVCGEAVRWFGDDEDWQCVAECRRLWGYCDLL